MGRILEFIERETEGHTFTSFKRCYDNFNFPSIEYETQEDNYENLEKYAEDNQSPKPRNLTERAKLLDVDYTELLRLERKAEQD